MGCDEDCLKVKEEKTDLNNVNEEMKILEVSKDKEAPGNNSLKVNKTPSLNRARTNADEFDLDTYKNSIIKFHNEIRGKHKSPSLKENEKLNDLASIYAESLVNNQEKINYELNMYNDEIVGENIIVAESKRPEDAIKKIIDEEKNYDFNSNKFSKATGHFTQAIWKDTTDIGCGFWVDKINKKYYIVLLYYPAGNIFGKFSENVISDKN